MQTGYKGTFVISWAQTELDGARAAPPSALGVGAVWRWWGEAVRVDGPADIFCCATLRVPPNAVPALRAWPGG